ncbi:hypothetical protein LTR27_000711 [Elasticomyces elasticus]|nr:hypothetical protein LTR27_000711 [Elasticomyces elasticus]
MAKASQADEQPQGLFDLIKSLALKPFHIVLSKTALRAYLTTFLAVATGIALLGFAITAYTLFYWSYIPRIGFERTIHLQFDNVYGPSYSRSGSSAGAESRYPHGTVSLWPEIVGVQRYDVVVELDFPRTPDNVEAGNFMLEVNMYAPEEKGRSTMQTIQAGIVPGTQDTTVLATSRRPAILQYRSPLIELAYKFTELHWYLLNFRQESESLRISMFEGVEFPKGWRNVPATLKLEVQSTRQMQIYSAKAVFRARFRGLRWLMYNHRILSAIVFISGFWMTEMVFAGLAWAALTVFFAPGGQAAKAEEVHEVAQRIKADPEDDDEKQPHLSDTERTFPTLSGQQPLRYESETKIKQEFEDMAVVTPEHVVKASEADVEDEDEDADFFLDSGMGTSMESSNTSRRDSMRRRRGRAGLREND